MDSVLTVGVKKNSDVLVPFRPIQMVSHCSCWPHRFCFVCMCIQLVIGRGLLTCKKKKKVKGQLIHLLTIESIVLYCHGLLNCSGAVHYRCFSILREFCDQGLTGFEVSYRRLIDLVLPIDSDLDIAMFLLALLDT